MLDHDQPLLAARPGLLLIADKGYISAKLDDNLHARGADPPTAAGRSAPVRPY
jgi:hypothetical protein